MIYVFWTCRNLREAKRIVRLLLEARLIACASIWPEVRSVFRWKGKIEEAKEVKVILKTQGGHFDSICTYIQKNGSYEVPEILQVDVVRGNESYLEWVVQETSKRDRIST